jgi:hypothetical protein
MKGIETEFLMHYRVELAERSYSIGPTPVGQRATGGIRGGSFEGPRLRGVVEATGGDYARARPDDTLDADVRAVLHTDDDQLIYTNYHGLIHPISIAGRALAGRQVDQQGVYWRMVHRFEAPEGRYEWLNRVIAIGIGRGEGLAAEYEVYELL